MAAGETLFYHLTRRRLEDALPELLLRTAARGWRAVVRCGTAERMEALDRHLWTFRDDSFLPHGRKGGPAPERQPIYLTDGSEQPNRPDVLFLVDGATAEPAELAALERTCLLFDGRDQAAVAQARALWRAVVAAELTAVYWAEGPKGWEKKRESGGGGAS